MYTEAECHTAIDILLEDEEKYNTPLVYQVDPGDPTRRRSSILEETKETPKKKGTKKKEGQLSSLSLSLFGVLLLGCLLCLLQDG